MSDKENYLFHWHLGLSMVSIDKLLEFFNHTRRDAKRISFVEFNTVIRGIF